MRGVDTTVFMVDIPGLVGKRMQKAPIEFWKPRKADELRKAGWVYEPDWTRIKPLPAARAKAAAAQVTLAVDPVDGDEPDDGHEPDEG
jgi:hypothetical protein